MGPKMQTIEHQLSQWADDTFRAVFPALRGNETIIKVVAAVREDFGDYQCNAAMGLARTLKMSPRDIAGQVIAQAELPESVEKVEIAGPGFINIVLKDAWVAQRLDAIQRSDRLGAPGPGKGRTIIVDYSSPNVAKPMHIGHIRSTVIGNALDRMFRFLGYHVVADNHLGDWGTQFGLLIMGYHHFVDTKALAERPVEELERIYVQSYDRSREDPEWLDAARKALVDLQQGNPEHRALWSKFVELSMEEFNRIYKRLNISFDLVRGESYYHDKLSDVITALRREDILEESKGAHVVFLYEEKLPVCIIQKSDGGFNYATTDLATIADRIKEFDPFKIVYVTDERQQLHFQQIFAIARKMGVKTELVHIWFGLMRLPEGTFSTREGNVIKLERLLDEAESRALALVRRTSPHMAPEQQHEVARAVGIGALKYADLSQNPQSLVTFTWERALSLEGNSAPYLQYAYARICSVIDKYTERFPGAVFHDYPIVLYEAIERRLAIKLLRFSEAVMKAAEHYRPNILADYLYELSQVYSHFYQNVPFLKAAAGVRESRLRLCELVAETLRRGLMLLGIEAPNRI